MGGRVLLPSGASVDKDEYKKQLAQQAKESKAEVKEEVKPEGSEEKVEKPLSKMNVAELKAKAVSMGANEASLEELTKGELKEAIANLEEKSEDDL